MSRAFVNEDSFVDDLPDRPVSAHPNHVTERGLQLIESALRAARIAKPRPWEIARGICRFC
jgi:hypothetical protein